MNNQSIFPNQISNLSDSSLEQLNSLLPWMSFTVDEKGRKFGKEAWEGKRSIPEIIPDERIVKLHSLFDLSDKTVLEFGCFEGAHTIGLGQFAAEVYAIDSRIENTIKTIVRSNFFGVRPRVDVIDLENSEEFNRLPVVDILHHVGVFYHLKNPIEHLSKLNTIIKTGILLDTHYATIEMTNQEELHMGKPYRFFRYEEHGRDDVFSGMYNHAKWLMLEDIIKILKTSGFSEILVYKNEIQRNGPRVTLFASKTKMV